MTVRRPTRQRRLPKAFKNMVPSRLITFLQQYSRPSTPPVEHLPPPSIDDPPSEDAPPDPPRPCSPVLQQTEPNEFGLYRIYKQFPSRDPEDFHTLDDVLDAPNFVREPPANVREPSDALGPISESSSWFSPFKTPSMSRLFGWFYKGGRKTLSDLNDLVHNVLLADDFNLEDLPQNFDASREVKALDEPGLDNWKKSLVRLKLPPPSSPCPEKDTPELNVPVLHRDILQIIISAYQSPAAQDYHWKGFKFMWKPDDESDPMRVYGEAYMSEAFLEMEDEIQGLRPPECDLEAAVAPILLYTDSTKLTNFGSASLWPGYLWIGMLSKYLNSKPSLFHAHHFVYIPSVCHRLMIFLLSSNVRTAPRYYSRRLP